MIEIKTVDRLNAILRVPGSKSYTHRALIVAALADGESIIQNALLSEDTLYTQRALGLLGAQIEHDDNTLRVRGTNGAIANPEQSYRGTGISQVNFLLRVCDGTICSPDPQRVIIVLYLRT